jgi:rubrerythrin
MQTPDASALSMLKTALEMEEKGYRFYAKAVAEDKNELGRGVFKMLRDDEKIHIERIRIIFTSLVSGGAWTDEWKEFSTPPRDLGQIFRDLAQQHESEITPETGDLTAIDIGLDFEAKSVRFYTEELQRAVNPLERDFAKAMIAEEETHHELLADMKLYLTDPESWFREREKGGLDGA